MPVREDQRINGSVVVFIYQEMVRIATLQPPKIGKISDVMKQENRMNVRQKIIDGL